MTAFAAAIEARTVGTLGTEIGQWLDCFQPQECANDRVNCGYRQSR